MEFTKTVLKKNITDYLGFLEVQVKNQNTLWLFDINKEAEDFYAGLLNLVYGWNLVNANVKHDDEAGFDLIDEENHILVQVSSTNTSAKIRHSLEMIEKHHHFTTDYSLFMVFIAGKQSSYTAAYTLPEHIEFDRNTDILDVLSILKELNNSTRHNTASLQKIFKYLHTEITFSMPFQSDATDPTKDLDAYLMHLPAKRQTNHTDFARFSYDSGNTELFGRKREFAKLMEFAQGEDHKKKKLLWWAVTGRGGIGKSRLAYEVVNELNQQSDWVARFLIWPEFKISFQTKPAAVDRIKKNLFIVIDYVYTYDKEIGTWIQWISQHMSEDNPYVIRILLIERASQNPHIKNAPLAQPNWYKSLEKGFASMSNCKCYQYNPVFLNLAPYMLWINKPAQKEIVKSFAKHTGKQLNEEEILEIITLANLVFKSDLTPLMLQIVTESYNPEKTGAERAKTRRELLELVIEREFSGMDRHLDLTPYQNKIFHDFMVPTTIMSSANLDHDVEFIHSLRDSFWQKHMDTLWDKIYASQLVVMNSNLECEIEGIRPDIIGEAFVMYELEKYSPDFRKTFIKRFREKRTDQFSRFLERIRKDFFQEAKALGLIDVVTPLNKNTFSMLDDAGNEIVFDVLFTFESEENGKNYIVYTDNSLDKEGNTQVYASIYHPDQQNSRLDAIETEQEWRVIETILAQLQKEIQENAESLSNEWDEQDFINRVTAELQYHSEDTP